MVSHTVTKVLLGGFQTPTCRPKLSGINLNGFGNCGRSYGLHYIPEKVLISHDSQKGLAITF